MIQPRVLCGFLFLSLGCSAASIDPPDPQSGATGPAAIQALKQSGSFDSLESAWQHARYAFGKTRSGFSARNASQGLDASFDLSGLHLRTSEDPQPTALRLVGYGRADQLLAAEPARLTNSENRIEYRRGALTEWYLNDARGLEQGFTLSARPTGNAGKPLVIALDVTGALRPKLDHQQEAILYNSSGRAVLRYGELRSWDSIGRPLPSHLTVDRQRLQLMVDDTNAAYPITIDPLVSAVILLASDGASADSLGTSLAVDGNTAVVGAPGRGGAKGAVEVFVRSGSTWSQQTELTASDGARSDQFGISVSISGATILVGAPGHASGKGAAYVFVQSGTAWSQQASLTASDGAAGDAFGSSVSLVGSTAVAGAPGKTSGHGAVYVFAGSNGSWTQQTEFAPTDSASGDSFGNSVALNGTTVVAGAYTKNNFQGAAYVFVQSTSGTWSQQAKLAASPLASDAQLGFAVAVNADTAILGTDSKSFAPGVAYIFVRSGTTWTQQATFGSPSDSGSNAFASAVAVNGDTALCAEPANSQEFGEAFVFVRSGSTWSPQPKLTPSDGAIGAVFSTAVALDADTALFSSPAKNSSQGEAYAFVRSGSTFVQQAILNAAGASNADSFGVATAVSGNTVVVGAPAKSSSTGAAYVFVRSGAAWNQQTKLVAADGSPGDSFGSSVAVNGSTIAIGASGKGGTGAVYVFTQSGSTWTQQAEITAADAAKGDAFGSSVSISGTTIVIGASAKLSYQGAAYVFVQSGTSWTQQAKLTAADAATNDSFGVSVSLSGDTALVGARSKSSFQGAAYIFARSGTTWAQQSKLTPDPNGSNFGYSVSLDGGTALVGSYLDGSTSSTGAIVRTGAAYVFVQSGATWTRQAKLNASDAASGDVFGLSVSINGNSAAIGATGKLSGQGVVYAFGRSGSAWTQQFVLNAPDAANGDNFGSAVSINAGTIVATSPAKAAGEGEAYLFPFPVIASVVNGGSFQAPVAPGSLATVFGNNFSPVDTSFSVVPLPTSLNGVSVTVNTTQVPLIFAGYQQINFQMPYETPSGTANVVVTVNGVTTATATVNITATAPGILVYGANRAVVQNADFSVNATGNPAKVGSYITVYGTGLGQLDTPIPTGAAAPSSPLSNAVTVPTAMIGNASATVVFAGMAPGFVGLAQLDVQIPALATGTYPLVIMQGGQTSNAPLIDVSQ